MIGIVKGLLTTLSTFSRKPVTIKYPEEKHPLSVRERSFPVLLWDFQANEPMCTGCNICVRNCPVDCMSAEMQDNPNFGKSSDKKKIVQKFWIDYGRCMRCNICVEVCPFDAIVMNNTWDGHEHSVYDRRDLHLDIQDLLKPHLEGTLTDVFFPQDNVATLEAELKGEELPELKGMQTRPQARDEFLRKVEQGEVTLAVVTGQPPQAAAARGQAAAADGAQPKGDPMSPQKQRARRIRAEREAVAYAEANALADDVRERFVKRTGELGRLGLKADAALERAKGELEAGTLPEDGIGTPPADLAGGAGGGGAAAPAAAAGGAAPRGDPMSEQKQRARRMRAEREAKAVTGIPGDAQERFVTRAGELARLGASSAAAIERARQELDAGTLPEDGIGTPPTDMDLIGAPGGGGATGSRVTTGAEAASAGASPDAGPKGDPMSPQKQRARRMRAERAAKEMAEQRGITGDAYDKLLERAGELGRLGAKPDDAVQQALQEAGG